RAACCGGARRAAGAAAADPGGARARSDPRPEPAAGLPVARPPARVGRDRGGPGAGRRGRCGRCRGGRAEQRPRSARRGSARRGAHVAVPRRAGRDERRSGVRAPTLGALNAPAAAARRTVARRARTAGTFPRPRCLRAPWGASVRAARPLQRPAMLITRKLGKILRGKATATQVLLAATLGGMLGFVPGFFLPGDLGGGFAQAPGLILALV